MPDCHDRGDDGQFHLHAKYPLSNIARPGPSYQRNPRYATFPLTPALAPSLPSTAAAAAAAAISFWRDISFLIAFIYQSHLLRLYDQERDTEHTG